MEVTFQPANAQKKIFTRWTNTFLLERMLKIEDPLRDLEDGVILCNLLEILSTKAVKSNPRPKMKIHKIQNVHTALSFLKTEVAPTMNFFAEDIVDGGEKPILTLLWTLINHYHIGRNTPSLLDWVRSKIPELNISNFSSDWCSGHALCALQESILPGKIDLPQDFTTPLENAEKSISNAQTNMNIPRLVDPEDIVQSPDPFCLMTYIAYFRSWETVHKPTAVGGGDPSKIAVAHRCIMYGPGLEGATADTSTNFVIEARNNDTGMRSGGLKFLVEMTSPSEFVSVFEPKDHHDGTYLVTYQLKEGTHTLSVTLDGQHIKDSPILLKIYPGEFSLS